MMHDPLNAATLTPGQHYEPEELMSYALEMLSAEDRASVEAHLATGNGCAVCRQQVDSIRAGLGLFAVATAESVELASPPTRSRERLLAEVAAAGSGTHAGAGFGSAAPGPARPPAEAGLQLVDGGRTGAGPGKLTSWIGWAVAAGMAIAATHFYQQRETLRASLVAQAGQIAQLSAEQARARGVVDALTDRAAQRVTLTLTKAPAPVQPTGRATYLANKGTLIFLASHMEPLPAGKTYELWVIPASGAAPVPAGTFRPDERGNASVVTARLERTGAAKAFGVTVEPAGGSPTPTMPILLAGS